VPHAGHLQKDACGRRRLSGKRAFHRLPIVFTPINRWGTPADAGRAVASLAAGELPFTTGAAIQVDGGMHIHQY
jgi:NAD(P)-dependent dehydrogenase (short-subunit alcohol dehydrogenase family)